MESRLSANSVEGSQPPVDLNLKTPLAGALESWSTLATTGVLVPFLVCLLGLLTALHPAVLTGFQFIQTDPGDTRLNNYFLEQGYRWFLGLSSGWTGGTSISFWDAPFFYPGKNAMAYSDILLGSAPLYWVARGVGFFPDTAFQVWCASLLALNFICCLGLLRKLQFSVLASCAGSYLFAFATARIGQIGHAQLLPHFYTPLALIGLYDLVLAHDFKVKRRGLGLLAGALVAELYSGFYLGWFNAFGLALLTAVVVFHPQIRRAAFQQLCLPDQLVLWKRLLPWIGLFGALSAVALFPMASHYYRASQEVGLRHFEDVSPMLLRLQSWLFMGEEHPLYSGLLKFSAFKRIPMQGEQRAGLGLLTLSLVLLGFWRLRKRKVIQLAVWVWLLIGFFTLYTGRRFFGVEPWDLIYRYFPGAQAIRAVSRLCLLALIPASIGLAAAFDSLKQALESSQSRSRFKDQAGWGLSSLLLLVAAEQVIFTPSYDKLKIRADVMNLSLRVPNKCSTFFYSAPWSAEPSYKLQLDAMWASMMIGIPTLNGYSGNAPQGYPLADISRRGGAGLQQKLLSWDPLFDLDCWVWGSGD